MDVKFKRLTDTAIPFTRATSGSACLDMYCDCDVHISPHSYEVVPTGIAIEIPDGYYGLIKGRSGLATQGIQSHIGTVDSDYRGEVKTILFNHTNHAVDFSRGDRICQMEIQKVLPFNLIEVDELSMDTDRGTKGFGSTGK